MIRFKLAELLEKKQFRDSRRITLQEVSEATGINRSTLSKILNQKGYSTGTPEQWHVIKGIARTNKQMVVEVVERAD